MLARWQSHMCFQVKGLGMNGQHGSFDAWPFGLFLPDETVRTLELTTYSSPNTFRGETRRSPTFESRCLSILVGDV